MTCVTLWSRDLQSQDLQSRDTSIAVYVITYQYHLTLIPHIKSALASWKKEVLCVSEAQAR